MYVKLTSYNQKINISRDAAFLGVAFQNNMTWTDHMTWTEHINKLEQKESKSLNHLKALCGKHGTSPSTVTKGDMSYILLFQHAAPAWINISDKACKSFRTKLNKAEEENDKGNKNNNWHPPVIHFTAGQIPPPPKLSIAK